MGAAEPPTSGSGRLLTLRGGGWVLLASAALCVAVVLFGARGLLNGGGRAIGRPGDPNSYGYDWSHCTIDRTHIVAALPRDGLPALTRPETFDAAGLERFAAELRQAHEGRYLVPGDRVIGVAADGAARAYPLRVLAWHEVVNDTLAERPILVTYSGPCDSAVVFARRLGAAAPEFGVSGLLYQSNLVFYDKPAPGGASSLWSQLQMRAIAGPAAGTPLEVAPFAVTTWGAWQAAHPETTVLAPDRARLRIYKQTYDTYFHQGKPQFPVAPAPTNGWPLMTPVLGVRAGEAWRVFRVAELIAAAQDGVCQTRVGAVRVAFAVSADPPCAWSITRDVVAVPALWFAWYAHYPEVATAQP